MENCKHKRIKKNFHHGKKSTALKFCKDCGVVVTNKMIKERRKENIKERRKENNSGGD